MSGVVADTLFIVRCNTYFWKTNIFLLQYAISKTFRLGKLKANYFASAPKTTQLLNCWSSSPDDNNVRIEVKYKTEAAARMTERRPQGCNASKESRIAGSQFCIRPIRNN